MRLRSLLSDPLRALIALEAVALASSYPLDVFMATMHINKNAGDPKSLAVYTVEFVVMAVALFSIPHRPNRRYVAVGISLCLTPIMVMQPTGALGPVIVLAVLAARLTFAFGFRGTAVAWLVTYASLMIYPIMQFAAAPTFKQGRYVLTDAIVDLVLSSLLYGVAGIMWLYARQGAVTAAAAERARIALDLHDSLGHTLTTLGVHLENAERAALTDAHKTQAYISRAGALTGQILSDVRETVAVLHDGEAGQALPLTSLLDRLRSDFAAAHAIELRWRVSFEREPFGRCAHVLFRVLQEALTNAARHAQAHRVSVEVRGDSDTVSISVRDDGCGFSQPKALGHGLMSMQSRVESLAGTIKIASAVGAGTRIDATFPLETAV